MKKDISGENMSTLLLPQSSKHTWRKRVSSYLTNKVSLGSNKTILLLLLWHFSTGILYNLFLRPSVYLHFTNESITGIVTSINAFVFLVLTPLASFVADVKFGRFKTLLWSTYFMLASSVCILLGGILLIYIVRDLNNYFYAMLSFFVIALFAYHCARVFFIANILQFGTDQLRDMPTRKSTLFLLAFYWCDTFGELLALSLHIPGHEVVISHKVKTFDEIITIEYIVLICGSIALSVVVIFLLHKKKHWFLIDNIRKNPYRLVYGVVKFAIQHKNPVRRSAFTYCENRCPSRIDFGKQRYGGPFTTEEVEDVKVLFNMLKVLLSLSPAFFLDLCATRIISYHRTEVPAEYFVNDTVVIFFLDSGVLSPLLTVICFPLVIKCLISRYFPNMFKRMGLSLLLLCVLFTFYLMNYVIGGSQNFLESFGIPCFPNDSYNIFQTNIAASLSPAYLLALHNVTASLYHMFLCISIWEFICCQSPQHMKGLLFALFYALRDIYRVLAALLLISFYKFGKTQLVGCPFIFHAVNLIVGFISLVIFTIIAYKYQYRKRDDICNIYQYAEDYYSTTDGYLSLNNSTQN